MKILVVLLNVFLCPVGSFVAGKWIQGLMQLALMVLALFFALTFIGIVIAVPIALVAWIWGLITAASYQPVVDNIKRYG